MVKNTHGGSRHKSQARKSSGNFNRNVVVEPKDPSEKFAKVIKMYGNGMVGVELQGCKTQLVCHIRGKFRGKNKKHNNVVMNSVILVGLRDWESSLKNCDLIAIVESPVSGFSESEGDDVNEDEFIFSNSETLLPDQVIHETENEDDSDIDIDDI